MTAASNSNQRAIIFDAIRMSGYGVDKDEERIRREAEDLLSDIEDARPHLLADDLVEAFTRRFENERVVGTTCVQLEGIHDLPAAVRWYLEQHGMPAAIKVQPCRGLLDADWTDFDTDVDVERDDSVAVCWAEYGIAETGSVVVHSSATMPVLLNFLPLHLIVVVPRSKIMAFLDDYAAVAEHLARESETPRNMCLITGASGTTDIEGVLVKGAHGPKFLHVVVLMQI